MEENKDALESGCDEGALERTATIGDFITATDAPDSYFGIGRTVTDLGLIMEEAEAEEGGEEQKASKGDSPKAEDYYLRAISTDPADGEILAQYAKLVWELHHDQQRAEHYFERAAKASPQDSNVLGAVASFLWETDDSETQDIGQMLSKKGKEGDYINSSTQHEDGVGVDIASNMSSEGKDEGSSVEEYYKRLAEQNPSNSMVLRNYAHFLYKSKGDTAGAQVYYSRAVLADPKDGEILSEYANLVWQAYRDEDKARSYFERAVEAAPADSHVLAAYASFLWATGEEDDDSEV